MAAGVLAVPVALADVASATPCPSTPLPIPCLTTPGATTAPTITGTKQVGTVVTATAPVWDQEEVTTTYQWTRDGTDIAGATMATYTLTGADFDKQVVVTATGTNGTGLAGSSDSAAIKPTLGAAITPSVAPRILGSSDVGGTILSKPGTWPGTPEPTFTYQWFRSRASGSGYEAIKGATTASYSPVLADSGRRIALVVTASRPGFAKGVAASNVARVPKAGSSVRLTFSRSTVKSTQQAGVRVVVSSTAGIVPTGKVTILDGTRRLRTVALTTTSKGTASFKLPRLARGTHRLVARYVGDNAHLGSDSTKRVLVVTR